MRILAATGEHVKFLTRLVWSHLKIYWLSKDDFVGYSEKRKRGKQKEREDDIKRVDRDGPPAEDRTRWKGMYLLQRHCTVIT